MRATVFIFEPHHEKTCFCHMRTTKAHLACTSTQSDQRLCYSLLRLYNICSFYMQNFKPLASLCSWAGRFESYLVAHPEDRFSRDVAHLLCTSSRLCTSTLMFIIFLLQYSSNVYNRTNGDTCRWVNWFPHGASVQGSNYKRTGIGNTRI